MSGSINKLFDSVDVPAANKAQQTKALRRVADIAGSLWKTEPGSPELDLLAQKVGDAARVEASRIPLGESGLLEFFCAVVSTQGVRSTLVVQCLRVIGNSSADTDENRARVIASGCLPSIVSLLNDDSILAFVVPVLFNIAVDYEPAQKAIYQAGINPELVSLISGPREDNAAPVMGYIYKLLGFVATQEPEANLVHPATPFVLLSLANDQPSPIDDAEDFLGQVSVALTYLSQEQFQKAFLETPGSINLILETFLTACEGIDASQEGYADNEAQLKQVQTAFTATLADLSAHSLFASSCPLDGPEVQRLQGWISTPHIPLRSAACLTLGNIARSDEKCIYLVQQRAIHKALVDNLADPSNVDAGLLHSILSFLKNLAIPVENKPILGAGLLENEVLPRIWDFDTQTQVQFDAVSLTRLLLVGCPTNVHRIVSEDSDSGRSKLHLLIDLNKRSDQEPTQMETARAITTVCRVLHSPDNNLPLAPSQSKTDTITTTTTTETSSSSFTTAKSHQTDSSPPPLSLETFYSTHNTLTDAMLRLGLQTKFPALRSELLFVFALMARTPSGAAAVAQAISHSAELVSVITEVATGEQAPTSTPTSTSTSTSPSLLLLPPPSSSLSSSSPPNTPPQSSTSAPSTLSQEITQLTASLEAQAPAPPPPPPPPTTKTESANTQNKSKSKSTHDVDRENALVLIAELLRRCPDELSKSSKGRFEIVLHEGGERLLREKERRGAAGEDNKQCRQGSVSE
ncbi:armadillo-type protein [Xylaria sp. FL1042]|nr:armadillo-type protein [Xylaria sp. FL1042]